MSNLHYPKPVHFGLTLNKGRILHNSKQIDESSKSFRKALSIEKTPRTHYRFGRILESDKQFGLYHLYLSVLKNPTSTCAHRWLKETANRRGVNLKTNSKGVLPYAFNNSASDEYMKFMRLLLQHETLKRNDGRIFKSITFILEFQESLKRDSLLFTNEIDLELARYNDCNYSDRFDAFEGDDLIEPPK